MKTDVQRFITRSYLLFAALFLSSSVIAQTGFGLRAGFNISNQQVEADLINTEGKVGLDFAVLYHASLGDVLSIQPEIHFAQSNFEGTTMVLGQNIEFDATLNYIQVPILLQLDLLSSNESIALSPFFGPYAAVGISGTLEDVEIDWDGDYKRLDFGAIAGVMLKLGSGLFVDVRYNFGLIDVNDTGEDIEIKNQILGAGVGYIF